MGSLTWHDFLLGCRRLSLVVCSSTVELFTSSVSWDPNPFYPQQASGSQPHVNAATGMVDVDTSLDLPQQAMAACDTSSTRSKYTRKIRRLLEATISKIGSQRKGVVPTAEPTVSSTDDDVLASMEQVLDLPRGDLLIDTTILTQHDPNTKL